MEERDPQSLRDEFGQLRLSVAQLAGRVHLLERGYRSLRSEVDEMITADQIAKGVADELDRRRRAEGRHLSTVWTKLGIVALLISIPVSVAALTVQVLAS